MAYATILVRFFILLSPGRLIKKVGRVSRTGILYIFIVLFLGIKRTYFIVRRISGRYCALSSYHYATHTANSFRAVRHLCNHCAAERTCRFVSRWSGAYFIPIRSMFGRVGCIAHVIYRDDYNPGT